MDESFFFQFYGPKKEGEQMFDEEEVKKTIQLILMI